MKKQETKPLAPLRSTEGEEISPEQMKVLENIQKQAREDQERKSPVTLN